MTSSSLIMKTRRNHGLEHAALNLLSKKYPHLALAGHSDPGGFWLLGEVPTQEVQETVQQALTALRQGKQHLAVHPNCGTNLLASGTLAGLGGAAGLIGAGKKPQDKLERFPLIILLGVLGLLLSRPLGPYLQKRFTTTGNPGSLEVIRVTKHTLQNKTAHRISTRE